MERQRPLEFAARLGAAMELEQQPRPPVVEVRVLGPEAQRHLERRNGLRGIARGFGQAGDVDQGVGRRDLARQRQCPLARQALDLLDSLRMASRACGANRAGELGLRDRDGARHRGLQSRRMA